MPKAILTKGLIASGKTTWSKEFIRNNDDFVRLSRDDFRWMLDHYSYSKKTENIVTSLMNESMKVLIKNNISFIVDEQHLNDKFLNEKVALLKNSGYDVEIKEFPITLGEAIERDRARPNPIGDSVIKKTWRKYEIELKQMIDRHKPKYPWDSSLPYVIICDIDGTLSHSSQRRIFDDNVDGDIIIYPVWSVLDKYRDKVKVILMSGREEKTRELTEKWLNNEGVNFQELFMRKTGDHRSDTIVKRELFDEHIRGKYQPMFVIDDRPVVVDMWTKMGLFVFNVNQDPLCKNNF